MRITFDSDVDALTVVLNENPVAETVDAGRGRLIDLDDDGNVVAIEVLGATAGLALSDLASRFDLDPMFKEIRTHVRRVRRRIEDDTRLRDVLTAR